MLLQYQERCGIVIPMKPSSGTSKTAPKLAAAAHLHKAALVQHAAAALAWALDSLLAPLPPPLLAPVLSRHLLIQNLPMLPAHYPLLPTLLVQLQASPLPTLLPLQLPPPPAPLLDH